MSRYKGRQSAKAIEQDFPHYVDVVVPEGGLGMTLNAMYEFHARQGIPPKRVRFPSSSEPVVSIQSQEAVPGTRSSVLDRLNVRDFTNGRGSDVGGPIRLAKPDRRTHTQEVPHTRAVPHRPDIHQPPLVAALR